MEKALLRAVTWKIGFFALLLSGLLFGGWAATRLGGWRYLGHRLITLEPWPAYLHAQSQHALRSTAGAQVVLLGDSHVAQGLWQEWLPEVEVANRGIAGDDVPGVMNRLHQLDLDSAAFVVLQVGTNDLLFRSVEEILADYQNLLLILRQETPARLLVTTLPGINNKVRWTGINAEGVANLNLGLRVLVAKLDNVQLLELSKQTTEAAGVLRADLTADGVHLRGEGYKTWAQLIQDAFGPFRDGG